MIAVKSSRRTTEAIWALRRRPPAIGTAGSSLATVAPSSTGVRQIGNQVIHSLLTNLKRVQMTDLLGKFLKIFLLQCLVFSVGWPTEEVNGSHFAALFLAHVSPVERVLLSHGRSLSA